MGNYEKIVFPVGGKLEAAVEELLKYKEQGILACGDFNGFTFYSDTVNHGRSLPENHRQKQSRI